MHRRSPLLLALVLTVSVQLGAGCKKNKPFTLTVTSPAHGSFTTDDMVLVEGRVTANNLAAIEVEVRNDPVPLQAGGYFSVMVGVNPANYFNSIRVEATHTVTGKVLAERIVVVQGESVDDGDFSLDSIALRLNDSGLDAVEPVVSAFVDLDLASLLPPGTRVISDFCAVDGGFLGCLGSVDVDVVNPPASISGFGLNVDSMTGFAAGDVFVTNAEVFLHINGSGLAPSCDLTVRADTANIYGDYGLSPDAADPSYIDVNLLGAPSIALSGFQDDFTSGICDFPLIGSLVQLIIGDIEPIVRDGLVDFLADPDGSGPVDAPIAEGIETALAGISIAGPIGEGLGVNLEAPLFMVAEDLDGITLGSDGRVTANFGTGPGQCDPPPDAPDLLGSYHVPEAFPSFGPTTPGTGLPYDLGIAISTSAFNQLLKAEIECGLLQEVITTFGTDPLTAGLLSVIIPELAAYDPDLPLVIRVRPTIAPFVTGNAGPAGELSELQIGALYMDIYSWTTDEVFVSGHLQFPAGLDFTFDNVTSELVPTISAVNADDISIAFLSNAIGTSQPALRQWLLILLPNLLPEVAGSLGAFPLPTFLGLDLQAVSVEASGEFLSVFADLVSSP